MLGQEFSIPQDLITESTKRVSFSGYLTEIVLVSSNGQETILRLSSAGRKELINSRHFNDSPVVFGDGPDSFAGVSGLTGQGVTLSFNNSRNVFSFFALSDSVSLKSQRVKVWAISGQGEQVADSYHALVFQGTIDEIKSVNEREVVITAKAGALSAGWTPRIFLAPPLCNHLPSAGTKIGNLVLVPSSR